MDYKEIYKTMPNNIQVYIKDFLYEADTIGMSGAFTFKLSNDSLVYYLKAMPRDTGISLVRESQVIKWLQGKLPIPQLIDFTVTDDMEYMLLSEIPGFYACHPSFSEDVPSIVKILAYGMRLMHSLPIDDCPLTHKLEKKLMEAKQNVRTGSVDISDFEDKWQSFTPEKILNILQNNKPANEDLVFTHGDYCLPNILVKDGDLSGFIDLGLAGIADRYQDIALCLRSLKYNWGEGYDDLLLKEYGVSSPDWDKIEYYTILEELY